MMNINTTKNENQLLIALQGRLDTTTAPQLEAELKAKLPGITSLTLDMKELEYVSSAGLRVLLTAQKQMNSVNGKMVVCHVPAGVMEVFEMTGFCDILTITA